MKKMGKIYKELEKTGKVVDNVRLENFDLVTPEGKILGSDCRELGFFSIRYDREEGFLYVSGNCKFFTQNIKDSVFGLVYNNLDKIQGMQVVLFDDGGFVRQQDKVLFKGMSDETKLESIPLVSIGVRMTHDAGYVAQYAKYTKGKK